ncbi:hypothetical protein SARC_05271 [Sphaeroforma arctica JP610]|uniref:RNase III domain-containing protein n=2 Tax=Sphaeroforma arctica TaxID=72019 RepID=A0A0L0G0R2_9EUKA|nr:hypothetical protein SARC_05271 [Sphaeroforma arctica JP610]KNC82439.1 hypothetical protein SARC_05271 [Sphaeroforma arctica JP610]SYV98064.1 Dicer [Sphaeroforma arctica]|eukprot:XP_014156341.1 hypothetical protein SARC_05271 [Sphaeroforma arctica JP610]
MSGLDKEASPDPLNAEIQDGVDKPSKTVASITPVVQPDINSHGAVVVEEVVPRYSNGTVFYTRTKSVADPSTTINPFSVNDIQNQLASTHFDGRSSTSAPTLNIFGVRQEPTQAERGMHPAAGPQPDNTPFQRQVFLNAAPKDAKGSFHKLKYAKGPSQGSQAPSQLRWSASTASQSVHMVDRSHVNALYAQVAEMNQVQEQSGAAKPHNWTDLLEVGTTNGFFCTVCHQIQRRGHEWGSRKRQGLEPIGPCSRQFNHSFIPFYRGSTIMRVCRDCGETQRWGKKFGTNRSSGYEPLANVICGKPDAECMAYYYKILVNASLYVSPLTPVLRPDNVDAVHADNMWHSIADKLQQERDKGLDFQKEFPLFADVDRELINEALTHPSHTGADGKNYLRLAFLGDAVLDLYAAEKLYTENEQMNNGELTVEKSRIVANQSIGLFATSYLPFVRTKLVITRESKIAGDVIEALIGAYYLQFGYGKTAQFLVSLGVGR